MSLAQCVRCAEFTRAFCHVTCCVECVVAMHEARKSAEQFGLTITEKMALAELTQLRALRDAAMKFSAAYRSSDIDTLTIAVDSLLHCVANVPKLA